MKTNFFLSNDEVKQATQDFISKSNRQRNVKVSNVVYESDGSLTVTAEVVAGRKPKATEEAVN